MRRLALAAVLTALFVVFFAVFIVWPEMTLDRPTNGYMVECHGEAICRPIVSRGV